MKKSTPSNSPINGGEYPYRSSRVSGDRVRGLLMYAERMKELRKSETESESILWNLLRRKRFHGKKFRRQHAIGAYIVDFYCDELKLVIEVDGSVHDSDEARRYDAVREKDLLHAGYRVFRVRNEAVLDDSVSVLRDIERTFSVISPPFMGEPEGVSI
jgi:very-short-patch-repair endonuclease